MDPIKILGLFWKIKIHLTLVHAERPKSHTILAFLSAIGLIAEIYKTD